MIDHAITMDPRYPLVVLPRLDKTPVLPKGGPWDGEADALVWVDRDSGYPCAMFRVWSGAWCGYVGVPESHPTYGAHYDDGDVADVQVHGGLTYASGKMRDFPEGAIPAGPYHWFGFDCAHYDDLMPNPMMAGIGGTYRTQRYVAEQVSSLATQLWLISQQ